jgi:hypothetical protein
MKLNPSLKFGESARNKTTTTEIMIKMGCAKFLFSGPGNLRKINQGKSQIQDED